MVDEKDARHSALSAVAYHDAIARGWTRRYVSRGFRKRLSVFKEVLRRNVDSNQRWLDLGCGSGVLTSELIDCGAVEVVAIDASPAMLDQAERALGTIAGCKVQWVRADVQDIGFLSAESFDGVLCSSVIEYVEQPDKVLRGIARVLRSGGCFIISLPPKRALVRTLQKLVRRFALRLGKDVFSYLTVSRFEVDPANVEEWLATKGLVTGRIAAFDPYLSNSMSKVFRPSLLLLEGRKR